MLVTQSVMSNLLPASVNSLGRLDAPGNVRAYGFKADEQTVIVAWAEEYREVEIPLAGKPWRVINLQGDELEVDRIVLKSRPVYFLAEGAGLAELPW